MLNIFKRFPKIALLTGLCQVVAIIPAHAVESAPAPKNNVKKKDRVSVNVKKPEGEDALPKAGIGYDLKGVCIETARATEYVSADDIKKGAEKKRLQEKEDSEFRNGMKTINEENETVRSEEDNDQRIAEKVTEQQNPEDENTENEIQEDVEQDDYDSNNEELENENSDKEESSNDADILDESFEEEEKVIYISDISEEQREVEDESEDEEPDTEIEIFADDLEEIPEMKDDISSEIDAISEYEENIYSYTEDEKDAAGPNTVMNVQVEGMNYTAEDLYYLTQVIANEAGSASCSDEHQLAVGNVVLNRVKNPSFANTIKAVVMQPGQYDGDLHRDLRRKLGDFYYSRCADNAKRLLNGLRVLPENALYQANFVQGTGVCKIFNSGYSTTYICYGR